MVFALNGIETLTFDLNIYRGHLLTMTNLRRMTVTHKLFKILSDIM